MESITCVQNGLELRARANLWILPRRPCHIQALAQNTCDLGNVRLIRSRAGNILEKWSSLGRYDGQLAWGHAVAAAKNGDVYVTDILGMRVQKFVKAP